VFFSSVPGQGRIFQKWLNELGEEGESETSWRELDSVQTKKQEIVQEHSENSFNYVLGELITVLMAKGILSDDEAKAMLEKIYR
jgi:hypothetical protein